MSGREHPAMHDAIKCLLDLGAGNYWPPSNPPLQAVRQHDKYINRGLAPDDWESICKELSTKEHVALFCGLILADKQYAWSDGSVASAIWVFRCLQRRLSRKDHDALLDWALRERGFNPYVPLGHQTSARSLEELRAEEKKKAKERGRHEKDQKGQQEEAKRKREDRNKESKHRRDQTKNRSAKRDAIIAGLRTMSIEERFKWLANNREWRVGSLPTELFPVDHSALKRMSAQDLRALGDRLSAYRGHWMAILECMTGVESL